jgi:hypothetical protein
MKKIYADIIFLQDSEAYEALDILDQCGEEEALNHLKQWDMGQYDVEMDSPGAGSYDSTYERDGYIMTWNSGIGYIGLCLDITNLYPEGRY